MFSYRSIWFIEIKETLVYTVCAHTTHTHCVHCMYTHTYTLDAWTHFVYTFTYIVYRWTLCTHNTLDRRTHCGNTLTLCMSCMSLTLANKPAGLCRGSCRLNICSYNHEPHHIAPYTYTYTITKQCSCFQTNTVLDCYSNKTCQTNAVSNRYHQNRPWFATLIHHLSYVISISRVSPLTTYQHTV
jgi:hypothetical protein